MTLIKEYVLRQSTEVDIDNICDFLVKNWHEFNAKRKIDFLISNIKLRRIFILEDPENNVIQAVSAIFDHLGKYWQAGMSRVSNSVGGFGINQIFHYVRAVHAHIIDSTFLAYFAAIEASNNRSIENAKSVGFQEWINPPPQLQYQAITQSDKNLIFFQLPVEHIYQFAQWLLDKGDKIQLSRINRSTKEEETISTLIVVESLKYYKNQVEKLARKHQGNTSKNT